MPVLYVDLSPEEEALVLATLDPIGAMAGRDEAKLNDAPGRGHGRRRRPAARCSATSGAAEAGLTDPDEVPEPPEEPYVKPGDLWLLGDHRVLCGDATNPDDVARLLDGAAPRLLATDPPYGVSLDPTWRDGVYNGRASGQGLASCRREKPYMIRDRGDPAEAGTTRGPISSADTRVDWSEAFALVPSLEVGYVWHAGVHAARGGRGSARGSASRSRPGDLGQGPLRDGRGWYHWGHEPCWVVRKPGVANLFHGERDQARSGGRPAPR